MLCVQPSENSARQTILSSLSVVPFTHILSNFFGDMKETPPRPCDYMEIMNVQGWDAVQMLQQPLSFLFTSFK